jgi:Fur family ferric uptake transcriptional regulator
MERNTQQRQAILKAFENAKRPLAVQEILELAQNDCPGLGIATIYRNLKALVAENKLVSIDMPGTVVLYEMPGLHHHHHFSCSGCQKVFDIEKCGVNIKNLLPKGFTLERHEILLFGFCNSCS